MSKESFAYQMKHFAHEAAEAKKEDARRLAEDARRERVKQVLIAVVVAFMYGVVYFYHTEISDTVARLFHSGDPEYKELLKLADDVESGKDGGAAANEDPRTRQAKLRQAMMRDKGRSATVDAIMDYTQEPEKR